jgi:hypothetical protein
VLRFFESQETIDAIERLAAARSVTVIAGAGASMEIGLPSWTKLVDELFDKALELRDWKADSEELRKLVKASGPLVAAELVEELLAGGHMPTQIKSILYQKDNPRTIQPGPLASAIALLQVELGERMRLATTNYDEVLETALRKLHRQPRRRVQSIVGRPRNGQADAVRVVHLHGLLGRQDKGEVILTEGDYYRMQTRRTWQEEWVTERLSRSMCLFLGASLTDPNLIRYLYCTSRKRSHYVLFRRLEASGSRARWEQMERDRWKRLGVTPLYADNFADIPQFIYEVIYRRRQGSSCQGLPARLRSWLAKESQDGILTVGQHFGYWQRNTHDFLADIMLPGIVRGLKESGVPLQKETLAVSLWTLREPVAGEDQERVVAMASSDRIMTTPSSLAPVPLVQLSEWTGVKALCTGLAVGERRDSYASRWSYVLGVPIFDPEPRMPLGAITISSMGASPSTLETLRSDQRVAIENFVREAALTLFRK